MSIARTIDDTRTDYGIEKLLPVVGDAETETLRLNARNAHGRVYLTRSINKRHVTSDPLTLDEAKHLARCLTEAVVRAEAEARAA